MPATFTIYRKGTFRLRESSDNQCRAVGHQNFAYEVDLTTTSKLDAQGFVIDHVRIDAAVQRAAKATSCELLAQTIERAVWRACKRHGCEPVAMAVRVKPMPEGAAYIECRVTY